MKKLIALLSIVVMFNTDCARVKKKVPLSKVLNKRTSTQNKANKVGLSDAKQAVLIDFDTGDVLYDTNSQEKCNPSSMTKLMTVYLLFSAIRDGRLKMDDELAVSNEAQKMEGSRSFFRAGTYAKVEDIIRSIIVHSGNDACVIVAEALSGDPVLFTDEMNQKAKDFGLHNTHFTNPAGLPDEEHYSTAYDLAIIAQRLIKDFPEYYHYFAEKVFTVNGITQPNRNTLLGNSLGIDGLKTGHTNAGGYGLVSSCLRNGKRLIAVVNGCSSMKSRTVASKDLLTLGYREFRTFKTIKAGQPITTLKVWLGVRDEIAVCTHEDISLIVPRKLQDTLKVTVKMKEPIEAPVNVGDVVGELTYSYGNFISQKYDIFASQGSEQAGIFDRAKACVNYLLFGSSYNQEKESQ